jgi:putative MATE family efflux protein
MNIILDPIFIYILNLGIAGAAWATVISATLSCVVMSYWIWGKKDLYLDLSPKNFSYSSRIMLDTLQVAIPSTLENVVFSALAIIVNSMLVMADGTTAVAVYTASMRIVQMCMIPLLGLGTAVLTVSGVAYGAHNHENLKIAHSYSIKVGFAISIALGAIMYIFAPQIASIFAYTSASASMAPQIATALSILTLFVLAIPHGMMSSMMFQGVGKGTYSLIITLARSLILESVFAYLFCFIFGWGVMGIYAGVVFGCFVGGTLGYIWAKFFIRKFKQISIRKYAPKEE